MRQLARDTHTRHRPPLGGRARRPAFTLIELLIVITVIGILAAILVTAIRGAVDSARKRTATQLVSQIGIQLEHYRDTYGTYPPELGSDDGLVSSECLTLFLGRGLLGAESSLSDTEKRAVRAKRDFLKLTDSLVANHDKNACRELIDPWGLPLVYNRTQFADDGDWSDSDPPLHNPKSYDLFSCGPLASRIPTLGGVLPNLDTFETNALHELSDTQASKSKYRYLYTREFLKVGRRTNEYIGNWNQ